MMNVDNVLAEKAKKREEKIKKMDELRKRKETMKPYVLF
jgi:hypothetical protein